jgi:hypothetical protein
MRSAVSALVLAGASLALASCGSVGAGFAGGPAYPLGYDAFYDGAYGPFYDGYWGGDGMFRYSDGAGHFRRDGGGHFSHAGGGGRQQVHGHASGGHQSGHH